MKKYKTNKKYGNQAEEHKLPSFEIMQSASQGDPEAVMKVLEHYNKYIKTLSIRKYYDENGCTAFFVDDTLRKRLEIALALAVSKFNII